MQYKVLSPKYVYYLGGTVYFISALFLAFIYQESMSSNEISARIILGTISTIVFLWFLFYISKFVFAKIDLANHLLLYGNLFFNQLTPTDEVKIVGRFLYFRRILKIQISGKTFYINSLETGVENYFQVRK